MRKWFVGLVGAFLVLVAGVASAITVTVAQNLPSPGNGIKVRMIDVTMDSSYPTGGETLTAATMGFNTVLGAIVVDQTIDGYAFDYNRATGKLQVFFPGAGGTTTVSGRIVFPMVVATIGNGQSDVEFCQWTVPEALTLTGVRAYATSVTATASVNVKEGGVTVLSAPITPVAGSEASGTVSDASLASGGEVTLHATTDGTGAIANLTVWLELTKSTSVSSVIGAGAMSEYTSTGSALNTHVVRLLVVGY